MKKQFLMGIVLLAWYIISLGWTVVENIHHLPILVVGECINVLVICFILDSLKEPKVSPMYFIVGLMLLVWYGYYTFIDVNAPAPYNLFYVVIDILTFSYIIYNVSIGFITKICYKQILAETKEFLYKVLSGFRRIFQ
jgi:hypothetical protein